MVRALSPLATFPVEAARGTATPCRLLPFNPTPRQRVADGQARPLRPSLPAIVLAATARAAVEEAAVEEAAVEAGAAEAGAAEAEAADANSDEATKAPQETAANRRFPSRRSRKVNTFPPLVVS
jgi:hypothetical protein